MIFLELTSEAAPYSDFEVETAYRDLLDWYTQFNDDPELGQQGVFHTSTCNIIERVRVGIAEGELPFDQVTFVFNGQMFQANKYGAVYDWPTGWCDQGGKHAQRILNAAHKRRMAEMEARR